MSEFLDGRYSEGQRVVDAEEFRGSIRYIGPVASAKKSSDVWLGIEWDKDTRGKHDGSCVDSEQTTHRYFTCSPGAGSFVKPTKIKTGRDLTEALAERYVDLNAPLLTSEENTLTESFVVTAKGERKAIEFVGESTIRKHQQLADVVDVSARSCDVSKGGGRLRDMAGHVISLDLQDNLLGSWNDVAEIARSLPNLTRLLLHGNRIGDIKEENVALHHEHFRNLQVIALNFCGLKSWESVRKLNELLPSASELYLAANVFKDASSLPSSSFSNVTVIDLSSCSIPSWRAVMEACGDLQQLEALVLDCNPFEDILPNEEGKFSNLSRISLANTRLSSWADVNALSTYPKLSSVRLTSIPLFTNKGASEVRPEVIARIALLQVFNGSNVTARERMESEKVYLRKVLRQKRIFDSEDEDKKSDDDQLSSMHPRFVELNEKHGADLLPMGGEGLSSGLSSMASDMVSITFHNMSFASNGSLEPVTRKLPGSLKVDRLRLMVKQLFGLEAHKQQLSIRQFKGAVPTLMDEDGATIGYFGAIDGADIFINESKE